MSTALQAGCRLIDTAVAYFNEREVGQGIRDSGIDRAEVFLTTRLWMPDHGFDNALRALDTSTAELGVNYLDLHLLHWSWPANWSQTVALPGSRTVAHGGPGPRHRRRGLQTRPPVRAGGGETDVVPANQIELHPNLRQLDQVALHRELGILTQAWSPIGGITFYPGRPAATRCSESSFRSGA